MKKVLLVLLGMMVFLEASFQGVDQLVKNKSKKKALNKDVHHVLFVGDSTTWGAGLTEPEKEAYPALVVESLKKKYPNKKIEAVNLASPGQTSFSILNNLELNIAKYNPIMVVGQLGASDLDKGLNPITSDSPLFKSKLFRFIYLSYLYFTFNSRLDTENLVPAQNTADTKGPSKSLKKIVTTLEAEGLPFVLLNYFKAPKTIQTLVRESGAPYIELEEEKKNYFSKDNWHPNKEGHKLIADKLFIWASSIKLRN